MFILFDLHVSFLICSPYFGSRSRPQVHQVILYSRSLWHAGTGSEVNCAKAARFQSATQQRSDGRRFGRSTRCVLLSNPEIHIKYH